MTDVRCSEEFWERMRAAPPPPTIVPTISEEEDPWARSNDGSGDGSNKSSDKGSDRCSEKGSSDTRYGCTSRWLRVFSSYIPPLFDL